MTPFMILQQRNRLLFKSAEMLSGILRELYAENGVEEEIRDVLKIMASFVRR